MKLVLTPARWLAGSMVLAVAAVGVLAYWDDQRESRAGLEDFATEQVRLAASAGSDLAARLSVIHRHAVAAGASDCVEVAGSGSFVLVRPAPGGEPPVSLGRELKAVVPLPGGGAVELQVPASTLLAELGGPARPGSSVVLVRAPGDLQLRAADGRQLTSARLSDMLASGESTARLAADEASALGLSARTAIAGASHLDAGPLGRWSVVVVSSAERERDRERRGSVRLLLAVVLAAGLVLAFGGVALRWQRRELLLAHELAVAEVSRERNVRLQRLSKAATTLALASGVAHELGTPLGVIVGRAEQLLARAGADEKSARNAQAILDQADRISRVVRGFLDLARGAEPQMDTLAPGEVVSEALALVQHRFDEAQVAVVQEVPAGLPSIRGDRRLLEHALVNLLLNACDACRPGGRVAVKVVASESEVAFSVTDDGEGITPANAARIAEPFFTTKPAGKGTGLGLAITSEIVASHRGQLTVGPALPHGTCAAVRLPRAPGVPDAHA